MKNRNNHTYTIMIGRSIKRLTSLRVSYSNYLEREGVSCTRPNLRGEILDGVNLSGSDLREADLRGASLIRTDFRWANLQGALMDGAIGIKSAQFLGANVDDIHPIDIRNMIKLKQIMESTKNGIKESIFD